MKDQKRLEIKLKNKLILNDKRERFCEIGYYVILYIIKNDPVKNILI